ncbi:hypothetical protein L6164_012778 [Bauhinia variegata]|uniref:Uncharacterized protein n=1 Tax=Bauhinia variegata TaxID=167791 RepID=A0ACB9PB91_BAUVA|nr:hypothetical protein L6164_012778 [Bauhinia variegata]
MATLLHSESRRLYSWWWDSHISPKNSKWLQENLTDMDAKVKAMIKLIEEDADSFARRAEMYYKKRPELMKLVEEFYRAYRALAERYDHATGELRQAHRTMAEAFPNMLADDSPSGSSGLEAEPHTPEMPHPIRALLEADDLQKDGLGLSSMLNTSRKNRGNSEESDFVIARRGLKQLNEIFGFSQLSAEKQNLKTQMNSESEHAGKTESEVETLKKSLGEIQSEKDAILLQYQRSLEKLSEMETDLSNAQKEAGCLDERASKAEIEIKILKESLAELKAERDAGLSQYNHCLERISSLERKLFLAQKDAKELDEKAAKAKAESENLKQELARLEAEKDAVLLQYKMCLEKITILESKMSLAEENSRILNEQLERAEMEVKALKKHLAKVIEEKEDIAIRYKQCLETIAKMESEILIMQENSERLNREIVMGVEKLQCAEKHCDVLERSNQSLKLEADNLVQKIAMKDQELLEKHTELERVQTLMQEEHSRFLQIEAALQTLQKLQSHSEEEQRSLALELKMGIQMLKDLELSRQGFKEEVQKIAAENRTLYELNSSSTMSIKNQQTEISKLKEIKEKLEREVTLKAEESNALHQEIDQIKGEIQGLSERYQAMLDRVESVGLSPDCFTASVKDLQNENLKLKEVCKIERDEKEALHEKSKEMDNLLRANAFMENSLSSLNDELDGLQGEVKKWQESCQVLQEEKSSLVAEKTTLLSQLQTITESMQKLLDKNALLEKSLSGANIELEGLRSKSSSLEEFCKLLNDEKSNLLNERSVMLSQLESIVARLGNLETRFTELEEKYSDMQKDKEITINQVVELRASLLSEKDKHESHKASSEARLVNLENLVHLLQEERRLGKIEFEEELEKAVNAQVEIFILQRFMEDLEQKNLGLLVECQRRVEASKFSDKIISELESENLEQQMEMEYLLDEIKKLRMGIHRVYGALQIDQDKGHGKGVSHEEVPIAHILDNIQGLKGSLINNEEKKQQLLVENSVLLTLLLQLESDGAELESKKNMVEQEFKIMREQHAMLKKDKVELQEMNRRLRLKVINGEEKESMLKSELENLQVELVDLQGANVLLQEENYNVLEEKNSLFKSVSDLKDAKSAAEDENSVILHEALALRNLTSVYESFITEKALEQKVLAEHLSILQNMNSELKQEIGLLREKFEAKEAESECLGESVERMNRELEKAKSVNDHLSNQIAITEDLLKKKESEILEMEQRLKAAETLNVEFCKSVGELKTECHESKLANENLKRQISELSEDCMNQKKEIEHLNEANRKSVSEIGSLREEIEQQRVREKTLNSELLEKTNESEIWEAEAATFYFDLQISSVSEALLESKVNELTGVCASLKDENSAKRFEIEQMRGRVSLLENEIGGLKGQLSAYIPVITSLEEDFSSLEHAALLRSNKASAVNNGEQTDAVIDTCLQENSSQNLKESESTVIPEGVSDLLNIQTRIREVERVMVEEIERRVRVENLTANNEVAALTEVTKNDYRKVEMELKDEIACNLRLQKTKSINGSLMKDIPLDQVSDSPAFKSCKREKNKSGSDDDQMLELWEAAEQDCCDDPMLGESKRRGSAPMEDVITCHESDNSRKFQHSSSELEAEKELGVDKLELSKTIRERIQDGKRRKILERLATDAQKLTILKTTLEDLKKTETNKRSKKRDDTEFETVRRQIRHVEEAVVQLVDINDKVIKDLEENPSSPDKETPARLEKGHIHRKRLMEQARRGSEQIGRLQLEIQNIQHVLLKLADEKKSNGKKTFSVRTGILLREFLQSGKRSSKRRTKMCFCGYSRPSTNEE